MWSADSSKCDDDEVFHIVYAKVSKEHLFYSKDFYRISGIDEVGIYFICWDLCFMRVRLIWIMIPVSLSSPAIDWRLKAKMMDPSPSNCQNISTISS